MTNPVRPDGRAADPCHLLVIGAGPGLGGALAHRFAQGGYHLTLLARHTDGLAKLARGLADAGAAAGTVAADASDPETRENSMKRMFRRLTRARAALIGMATVTIAVAITGVIAQPGNAAALPSSGSGQWPMAGQNIDDTHFQAAEHVISPANVGHLAPRWTLTTAGAISATPTVDDGTVYVPDYGGKLWAVASGSGKVLWSQDISAYTGVAGDLSRNSPAVYGDDLILGDGWILSSGAAGTTGARVFAVNRFTGKPVWSTLVDTDPNAQITGSPVIFGGVAYVGISSKGEGNSQDTFRGAVVALNAATGKLLWKSYTVPSNNGGGDSNKPGYYSGNAVWESTFAVDPLRGLLYIDTGNNYSVPAGVCTTPQQTGCTAPAADDYVDSLLALRLGDGTVAWADHTLNGDVWTIPQPVGPDFDFGAGPNLFTTINPATGRPEQLLGAGQKSGVYWAVDPSTGKVVWQAPIGGKDITTHVGIVYGTATDGRRIYAAEADAGKTVTSGFWAALDAATGKVLWQTPDPQGAADFGFVSTANGVVYAGSMVASGTNMYALDAATGKILWSFASGGSVSGGAAIVDGSVYWGSGYCGTLCLSGTTPVLNNNKVYAFGLG